MFTWISEYNFWTRFYSCNYDYILFSFEYKHKKLTLRPYKNSYFKVYCCFSSFLFFVWNNGTVKGQVFTDKCAVNFSSFAFNCVVYQSANNIWEGFMVFFTKWQMAIQIGTFTWCLRVALYKKIKMHYHADVQYFRFWQVNVFVSMVSIKPLNKPLFNTIVHFE